jgi:hypothetical protein
MCSGDEYACRQCQQRFAMHAGLEVLQKTVVQQAMDAGGHQGVLQTKVSPSGSLRRVESDKRK